MVLQIKIFFKFEKFLTFEIEQFQKFLELYNLENKQIYRFSQRSLIFKFETSEILKFCWLKF